MIKHHSHYQLILTDCTKFDHHLFLLDQHKNEITTTENSNAQSDEYYASAYDLDGHAVDDARGIFLVYARDDDQFGDTISYLVRAASGRVAYVSGDYVSFDRDGTVIHW